MHKLPYASLQKIRDAIQQRRIVVFSYNKTQVRVEPHLLGHARGSGALVLCGWSEETGWQNYRYFSIRDFNALPDYFRTPRNGSFERQVRLDKIDTTVRLLS